MKITASICALAACAFSALLAHSASAQGASNWTGTYVGAGANLSGGQHENLRVHVDPARDSRLTYFSDPTTRVEVGDTFEEAVSPTFFAGWKGARNAVLWGVEATLTVGGPRNSIDKGYGPQSNAHACADAVLGCLVGTLDAVKATVDTDLTAALRFTIGVPVRQNVLISAYAGPAVAWASMDLSQDSSLTTGRPPVRGVDCAMHCPPTVITSDVDQSYGRSVDDSALGLVVGVMADVALGDRVIVRTELGYSRFEAFRGTVGGGNGANSEVVAQSAGFNALLGLAVRF